MIKIFKLIKNYIFLITSFLFLFSSLPIFALATESTRPVLLIVGTRPEAIKMIPVYQALKDENIPTLLCSTGQHQDLLEDIFKLFKVIPDFDFKIMKENQDLFDITEKILINTKKLFKQVNPSLVVVQGDTTSAMTAALSAFYLKIPIAHIEAGLRTENIDRPFPEEMNRRVITLISSYHFAPTKIAVSNLLKEGIKKESIFLTGNTVIDALLSISEQIQNKQILPSKEIISMVNKYHSDNYKIILLTVHRRESFKTGLRDIFTSVKEALQKKPKLFIIYPIHPNPILQKAVEETKLNIMPNIKILPALPYQDMTYILNSVDGILTDSGGVQEEAIGLNKPVLVLRNETGRKEILQSDMCQLVGTNKEKIIAGIDKICTKNFNKHLTFNSIYGDGVASKKIAHIIKNILKKRKVD